MSPTIPSGTYVLSKSFWLSKLIQGDIVIVKHDKYQTIVKRIKDIQNDQFYLVGDNTMSTTSEEMGWVSRQNLIGKVIWIVSKSNH